MSDKDSIKYGKLTILVWISLLLWCAAFIYFLYIIIYSICYHFNNDTLTTMQVFKLFLKRYIIAIISYMAATGFMKGIYKEWKRLDDMKDLADPYKNKED